MNTIISMLLFSFKNVCPSVVFFSNNRKAKCFCENVRNKSIRSNKASEVKIFLRFVIPSPWFKTTELCT